MIIFLLMNLIAGACAFLVNYRILRFSNFIDSLLSLFLLYFSQIILTEIVLGIWGRLFIQELILLNLAIFLVAWFLTGKKESSFCFKITKEQRVGLFNNKAALFAASVILAFASVKVVINLVNPPFGWDDLNYHFTFPVEWLKHGNLGNPITISDDPSPSYYPIGASLFFLWLILPFKSVFLADAGQIPFFILAFLAAYGIARKVNLNRESSFYAASLFLIIPNFFKQLQIAYVDVMAAALFLTCLNFLFLLSRDFSLKNLLAWSLSLGLFLSTKTIALPYAVLLFLPFIYPALKNLSRPYLFIPCVFIVIAVGGFSYIRNFIETGNFLYPLDLNLFGRHILKGVIDTNTYRAHFRVEDYRLSKLLFHEGLGLQSLLFILPSAFLALPVALIKRRKTLDFNLAYFLVLPILIYLVYRYIIPLANTRYLYPLLGTGMVIGFYTMNILGIPRRIINTLAAICVLASIPELAKRQELIISVISAFLLFFLLPPCIKYIKQRCVLRKRLFIYLPLVFIILVLALLEKDYVTNEYPRYITMIKYSGFWPEAARAWNWLNENTQGNNIAYVGRPVPFPLYGANFKNNVYYVSVNKTEPAKLHNFANSRYRWAHDFSSMHRNLEAEGNYRAGADYPVWLNNLIKLKTDYLFVYSLHQTRDIEFPLEDAWAKTHSDKFNPAFVNRTIHIYKILK